MEDGDDDFGDLYADVEVEATSAINFVAPQLQCVGDETGKQNSDKDDRASDVVDDDVDDEEEEDDDDDLEIVLNIDDDSIRHGEGFTISRNNTIFRSRDLKDEDRDNFGTEEFMEVKAACENDLKGSGCEASAYLSREDGRYCQRMGSRSTGPQCGLRFSLPRSRNILDVNIDVFEHKPWKHPGADITDYFNFGFNEDSWKLYCNQVDECRHSGHMSIGTPASEPVQIMEKKAFEDRLEHEIVSCGDLGESESRQWMGQAIQVEGSIYERQSSMDVRRRLDRDSDVIQITIMDPDHCSGSAKEGSGHLDSSVPEASNHGDVSGNDGTDHLSFSSASEDEYVDGNHLEIDTYAPKRSSTRRTTSKPVRRDTKKQEIHQISDGSGGPDEAIRNSYNTNGRTSEDPCTTDLSILVAESSEAEKSPANHRKVFENGACIDRRRAYSLERCPSTMSCRQSVKVGHHHWDSKRPDDERGHGENIYHARHANPIYNNTNQRDSKSKRHDERDDKRRSSEHADHARCYSPIYDSRTCKDFKPRPNHENDDICSRRPVDKRKPSDCRYLQRHSSPIYDCGTRRGSKLEARHEYNYSFLMSDVDGTRERFHGYNSYDEENVPYLRESKLPSDYYDERFSSDEGKDTLARDLHCKGYERLGVEMDRSVFRGAKEEEYFGERRRYTADDKNMARDWCCNESELAVEDVDFFSGHEFGWKNPRYPPYLKYKRGALWKRNEDDMQFRNKDDDDDYFLERECSDDIKGEDFRSITYGNERDDFECRHVEHVAYTRWEFRGPGRNNRRFGSPSPEINNHLPKRDDHSFASRSSEESYMNNGRWVDIVMPRNASYRRRGAYRGQWTERFRHDGSFGGYSEPFDREDGAIDINDRVDMGTRSHWQSEKQRKEDEIMLRHEDAKLHAERALFSFKKMSRHKRFVSECEPDHVESIDDRHLERRRYKKIEGTLMGGLDSHLVDGYGNAEGCRYKQTKEVINGNKHRKTSGECGKQPSLSCRSSLDSQLVARDRKSSEKHDKGKQIKFDIEEGQSLAKEVNTGLVKDENKSHNQKGKTVVDNPRILEAMAKMEKRRARFNDPVTVDRKNSDSLMVVDSIHETDASKQQRPARKRRWGGI